MNENAGAPWRLTRAAHDAMAERAAADYPEETCGLVFGEYPDFEVVPMENIQNQLHAKDPERYQRDAKTAYEFEPKEMMRVLREHEDAGVPLAAIYHSHPDHDAYFSDTDSAAAAPFGGPNFPGTVYLVYSVRDGQVADLKAFDWSDAKEKFVEVAMEVDRG